MTLQVSKTGANCVEVLSVEFLEVDTTVVLEGANSCDDDGCVGTKARLAALDVDELLGAEVCAEAGLGYDVVDELEC